MPRFAERAPFPSQRIPPGHFHRTPPRPLRDTALHAAAAESLVRFKAAQEDVRAIVPFARYGAMCGHEAAFRAGRLSMPPAVEK